MPTLVQTPLPTQGASPEADQRHSHRSPVVRGKCHVRAVVEEDPNAAVGELVAKAILVGIIHPLAHPDKVLMAGQGSWVFLRCWRREDVSSGASQPLSISPPPQGSPNRSLHSRLQHRSGCYLHPKQQPCLHPTGKGMHSTLSHPRAVQPVYLEAWRRGRPAGGGQLTR